jgi:hypothetical protein
MSTAISRSRDGLSCRTIDHPVFEATALAPISGGERPRPDAAVDKALAARKIAWKEVAGEKSFKVQHVAS